MAIFRCKMCGGTLEVGDDDSVAVCEYCGTKQTLPKLDDEKRMNLYDRANHFRRNNEYDRAMNIYEQILNEDKEDAEAYWSLVLCRYGIEYVEDPETHKRIPTVNRTQFASIYTDQDYKLALQYADGYQREIYEQEARAIDEIQKGILAISQKEEPFDVFICYKESDDRGRRTPDSVLAAELYHELTEEGFRVFFSRITLEDKLGSAYEPYIFAALHSAKVMVVLGTRAEYFNGAWVKNEWSRYLSLIKAGEKKTLIPAYKDMDPYDLPEEFSHLQAQDMSKLGFMQDIIRGIEKIAASDNPKAETKENVGGGGGGSSAEPLLRRAFLFLEDKEWESADEYCEKVLDLEPENGRAYLCKLLAEKRLSTKEELWNCREPFDDRNSYQKAIRFGDPALVAELQECVAYVKQNGVYTFGKDMMNFADSEEDYQKAMEAFGRIPDFKDASQLAEECVVLMENRRKDVIYEEAQTYIKRDYIGAYELAIEKLRQIPGWKDAEEQIALCQKGIERLKEEEVRKKERDRKRSIIMAVVLLCLGIAYGVKTFVIPSMKYNDAVELMEAGKYREAIEAFRELGTYQDADDKIQECSVSMWKDNLENPAIGDNVLLGAYEQDNDLSNGKEDIQWIVLDKEGSKVLLLSKYGLDCVPYHKEGGSITWETCSLRSWLNQEFLMEAFSKELQEMISITEIVNKKNAKFGTKGGKKTEDKIFLLSTDEVKKYFASDEERVCMATDYIIGQGVKENKGKCWWWLRSPGVSQEYATGVNVDGSVDEGGNYVVNHNCAVRPAIWIDLDSIE